MASKEGREVVDNMERWRGELAGIFGCGFGFPRGGSWVDGDPVARASLVCQKR